MSDKNDGLYVSKKPQPEFKLDLESLGMVLDEEDGVTPQQRDVILAEHDLAEAIFSAGTRFMYSVSAKKGPFELDLTDVADSNLFVFHLMGEFDCSADATAWVARAVLDIAECAEAEKGIRVIKGGEKGAEASEIAECMRILASAVDRLPEDER